MNATTTGQQAIAATKIVFLTAIAAFVALVVMAGALGATGHLPPTTTAAPVAATAPAAQPPAPQAPITQAPAVNAPAPTSSDEPVGCWNEPNKEMPTGYEMIQGPLSAAPAGSIITDCPR